MFEFFKKIPGYFDRFLAFLKTSANDAKLSLQDSCARGKDLFASNVQLAYYHLEKGNIADAIMRFKIVLYFAPEADKAKYQYQLGRCYFYKGKMTKAEQAFILASSDASCSGKALERLEIINNMTNIKKIPNDIIAEDYDFFASQFKKFVKAEKYIAQEETIGFFKNYCQKNTITIDNPSILDIGCGLGLGGYLLKQEYPGSNITGVDLSANMIKEAMAMNESGIYDDLSTGDYLQASSLKFNLVLAVMSLQFNRNLNEVLTKVKSHFNEDGIMLICLPLITGRDENAAPLLSLQDKYFYYSKNYIEKAFLDAGLKILDSDIKQISTNLEGMIIICKLELSC